LLSTLFSALAPLGSSRALDLIVALVLSAAAVLIIPDQRLAILPFLVQRVAVTALLWTNTGESLGAASLAATLGVGLVYATGALGLWHTERRGPHANRLQLSLSHLPFRVLVATLGVLLTYGLVQEYGNEWLPRLVAFTVAWLLIDGSLVLLVPGGPLHTGLGILTLADAGRVLYALASPDPLVWGLWAACDVLVALAATHLSAIELTVFQRAARPAEVPTLAEPANELVEATVQPPADHLTTELPALPDPAIASQPEDAGIGLAVPDQANVAPADSPLPLPREPEPPPEPGGENP